MQVIMIREALLENNGAPYWSSHQEQRVFPLLFLDALAMEKETINSSTASSSHFTYFISDGLSPKKACESCSI